MIGLKDNVILLDKTSIFQGEFVGHRGRPYCPPHRVRGGGTPSPGVNWGRTSGHLTIGSGRKKEGMASMFPPMRYVGGPGRQGG
jgi:hypothetical protein